LLPAVADPLVYPWLPVCLECFENPSCFDSDPFRRFRFRSLGRCTMASSVEENSNVPQERFTELSRTLCDVCYVCASRAVVHIAVVLISKLTFHLRLLLFGRYVCRELSLFVLTGSHFRLPAFPGIKHELVDLFFISTLVWSCLDSSNVCGAEAEKTCDQTSFTHVVQRRCLCDVSYFDREGISCCEMFKPLRNQSFTEMYILTCQLCCRQQLSLQVTPQRWWGSDLEDTVGRHLS
jgi:hypothetical protein